MNTKTDTSLDPTEMAYPNGAESKAYRITFTIWLLMFLVVLSAGLLNYIGTFLKAKWQ